LSRNLAVSCGGYASCCPGSLWRNGLAAAINSTYFSVALEPSLGTDPELGLQLSTDCVLCSLVWQKAPHLCDLSQNPGVILDLSCLPAKNHCPSYVGKPVSTTPKAWPAHPHSLYGLQSWHLPMAGRPCVAGSQPHLDPIAGSSPSHAFPDLHMPDSPSGLAQRNLGAYCWPETPLLHEPCDFFHVLFRCWLRFMGEVLPKLSIKSSMPPHLYLSLSLPSCLSVD
jgi:hypothetical protein